VNKHKPKLLSKPKTGCGAQISHNLHDDEELRLLMILRFLITLTIRNFRLLILRKQRVSLCSADSRINNKMRYYKFRAGYTASAYCGSSADIKGAPSPTTTPDKPESVKMVQLTHILLLTALLSVMTTAASVGEGQQQGI
jgi:hypothetical protein